MPSPFWSILPAPTLPSSPPRPIAYAAIHPARGIALLDVAPASTADAIPCVRAALARIGFDAAHPGHLPIIHHQLAAFDRTTLPAYLDAAFLDEPPITLGDDPEALKWPAMALRVFGIADVAALPAFLPGGPTQSIRLDARPSQRPKPTVPSRRTMAIAAGVLVLATGAGLLAYNAGIVSPAEPAPAAIAAPSAPANPPAAGVASVPPLPDPALSVAETRPLPVEQQHVEPPPPPKAEPAPHAPAPPPSTALLLKRGDEMLAQHDLASARRFYELAYDAGDGTAAISLGQTYDAADPAKAEEWYAKARASHDPRVALMLRLAKAARTIAPVPANR